MAEVPLQLTLGQLAFLLSLLHTTSARDLLHQARENREISELPGILEHAHQLVLTSNHLLRYLTPISCSPSPLASPRLSPLRQGQKNIYLADFSGLEEDNASATISPLLGQTQILHDQAVENNMLDLQSWPNFPPKISEPFQDSSMFLAGTFYISFNHMGN
ncbi:hypothetical protein NLJ89_g7962 [Agrocybe chaxingu]|uniref:Uncharacterized protein n=1 Tax=Agrocybe chaxingu TaxID=84603 RepID=A0A9W8JWC9_9AGAR|nr:hypothetical protein NLJ89_g7962 [Agrocybe chaxingu]